MAYCINCGSEIRDGAKFCTNCGAPQQPAAQDVHMQYGQVEPQQAPAQDMFGQSSSSEGTYNDFYGGAAETAGAAGDSSFGSAGSYDSSSYGSSGSYSSAGSSSYGGADSYSGTGAGGSTYGGADSYSGAGAGGYGAGSSAEPVPGPGFLDAVQTCFQNFTNFSGRARRSEYWYFTLFTIVGSIILGVIGSTIFHMESSGGRNVLQTIFNIITFIPGLAVFWRRMHDIGKSGLWFLMAFLPVIGWIVLLVLEVRDSDPGTNKYGPSPKYPGR